MVDVGRDIAQLLRNYRATAVRAQIEGAANRRRPEGLNTNSAAVNGGGAGDASADDLFRGVRLDILVPEGMVRGSRG